MSKKRYDGTLSINEGPDEYVELPDSTMKENVQKIVLERGLLPGAKLRIYVFSTRWTNTWIVTDDGVERVR
jgi:hypothetical protein